MNQQGEKQHEGVVVTDKHPENKTGNTRTDANNPSVPVRDKDQKNPSEQGSQPPKKDAQHDQHESQPKTGTNR